MEQVPLIGIINSRDVDNMRKIQEAIAKAKDVKTQQSIFLNQPLVVEKIMELFHNNLDAEYKQIMNKSDALAKNLKNLVLYAQPWVPPNFSENFRALFTPDPKGDNNRPFHMAYTNKDVQEFISLLFTQQWKS